jgi:hypothetical protein
LAIIAPHYSQNRAAATTSAATANPTNSTSLFFFIGGVLSPALLGGARPSLERIIREEIDLSRIDLDQTEWASARHLMLAPAWRG